MMKISKGYYNSEGKIVHDVSFENGSFKEIENIKKFAKCTESNCKYYKKCKENNGVVRKIDCKKNQCRLMLFYNIITGVILFIIIMLIFNVFHLKITTGIGVLIISLVTLDILSNILESMSPKIFQRFFYNKLNTTKKKEEKNVKLKEEKLNNPLYKKVLEAEEYVKKFKDFCQKNNFGKSNDDVNKCTEKLSEIIVELKKDSLGYARVEPLFEKHLPDFYNTLSYYSSFEKAKAIEKEYDEVLRRCVERFLKFLETQRVQAILDKDKLESQFKSTAEKLTKMIDNEECN